MCINHLNRKLKTTILGILVFFLIQLSGFAQEKTGINRVHDIIQTLKNPEINKTIVIAHRADWRNAPENSIKAIQNCIEMGVDVVELDIRMTKDSALIILHDKTVDRTTNGKGVLETYTLDSLKILNLKSGNGFVTHHQIPTLKEALLVCKDKILIDFDVKDALMGKLIETINEYDFIDQSIFFGYTNCQETKDRMGSEIGKAIYAVGMSKETKDPKQFLKGFSDGAYIPQIVAPKFEQDTDPLLNYFDNIKKMGSRIWVHTITANRSGNHNDDLAVEDADAAYGWLIDRGVTVFQTDRPQLLLDYLRSKELHD